MGRDRSHRTRVPGWKLLHTHGQATSFRLLASPRRSITSPSSRRRCSKWKTETSWTIGQLRLPSNHSCHFGFRSSSALPSWRRRWSTYTANLKPWRRDFLLLSNLYRVFFPWAFSVWDVFSFLREAWPINTVT